MILTNSNMGVDTGIPCCSSKIFVLSVDTLMSVIKNGSSRRIGFKQCKEIHVVCPSVSTEYLTVISNRSEISHASSDIFSMYCL